jgi:alpha-glucosidase
LGHAIFQAIRKEVKSINPGAYIIGEHWKDNIRYLLGDQWDGAMNYFASSRPLRCFAGEADRYLGGFIPDPRSMKKRTALELSRSILQHFTRLPDPLAGLQFNLLDSHDIHRFHHSEFYDEAIYAGLLYQAYLLPGTFSIYYGDEVGLAGDRFDIENVRYPMEWDRSRWNMNFFQLYRTLNRLKTGNPALSQGSYRILSADEHLLVSIRFFKEDAVIALLSDCDLSQPVLIPLAPAGFIRPSVWEEVFDGKTIPSEGGILTIPSMKRGGLLFRRLTGRSAGE